jgi:O-antigen ligase
VSGRPKLGALSVLVPIGCAGLIASLPLYFILLEKAEIEKPKMMTAMFVGVWIVVAVAGLKGRKISLLRRPLVLWCYLAFLALYYVNWSMWPKGTALDELMWAYSVANAVVPFVLGSMFQPRDLRPFWIVSAMWSFGLSAMLLIAYLEGGEAVGGRLLVAEALNPISQSLVIGYSLIVLCARLLVNRKLWPIAAATPVVFLMGLGGSRGPVIALIAGMAAMSVVSRQPWKRLVVAILVLATIPLVGATLPDDIKVRYLTSEDMSITARVIAAETSLTRWLEYPAFGSGTSGNVDITYSHNMFLQLLMETGVLGLLLFCAFTVPIVWAFMKRATKEAPSWERLALVGFLVYAMIEAQMSGTIMAFGLLWMVLGIVSAEGLRDDRVRPTEQRFTRKTAPALRYSQMEL